jgi:hypothetical protein
MVGAGDLRWAFVAFFNLIFPDGRSGLTGRVPRHSAVRLIKNYLLQYSEGLPAGGFIKTATSDSLFWGRM